MRNLIVNTLLIAAFALAVAISGNKLDKPEPEPTTTEVLTTTEEPTTKPETTTSAQKTTTTLPITTTTLPITTTTQLPPTPKKTTWNVTEGNITCILLEAGIRMTFKYENDTSDKKPLEPITNFNIDVPVDATASGTCGKVEQNITLEFFEGWNITLTFKKNDTKYDMSHIVINYLISPRRFPDARKDLPNSMDLATVNLFNVDQSKHYLCVAHQDLLAFNKSAIINGVVEVSTYNLDVEAFRNTPDGGFSSGTVRCSADEVSQLVPIIVGAVLAGLIVIVLIAYLIGRRRSRRGYESV